MRSVIIRVGGAALIAVLVAACGSGASDSPFPPPTGPRGFLATRAGSVFYIQWTERAGEIVGSLRTVALASDMRTTTASTANVTGLIVDGAFTISFSSDTGLGSWSGTLTRTGASIQLADAGGKIESVQFTAASDAEYNAEVVKLEGVAETLSTAAARVESAKGDAEESLADYERAKAVAGWYYWNGAFDLFADGFWGALESGDKSGARDYYRTAVDAFNDDVSGPDAWLLFLNRYGLNDVGNARIACNHLSFVSERVSDALDVLAVAMSELEVTSSPVDTTAAGSLVATVEAKAKSCTNEVDSIVSAVDRGYAATMAGYRKMVEKAKSLGW